LCDKRRKGRLRKQIIIGKTNFIKDNIFGNINTSRFSQAKISFMRFRVTKKYTLFGTKLKFIFVIRSKKRKTSTPKDFLKGVIKFSFV